MPALIPPQRKLEDAFSRIRTYLGRRFPRLRKSTWEWCKDLRESVRTGKRRAFMHVGHKSNSHVCVWPGTERLSDSHLYGLFLHEFGHIGQGASEAGADLWIFEHFGITIEYKGPKCLEWVGPEIIRSRFGG